jgi:hypothetical protein
MQLPSVQRAKHQGIRLPIPAVRSAPPDGGGSHLVSWFLPTRELSNNHHNPASHHECKNTPTFPRHCCVGIGAGQARHRDSAPTAHTAER